MKPGIQTFFAEAGEAACYAFCLADVADEWARAKGLPGEVDPCQALQKGVALGRIHYNEADANDEQNFYVDEPAKFLEDLTGVPWKVEKVIPGQGLPTVGTFYAIERWERSVTGATYGHFARTKAPRPFNSLSKSLCVERGRLVSLRICTPLA